MSLCNDSQDVGLEAAIIERVRNSSLVECNGADNGARLKHRTEAVNVQSLLAVSSRTSMVGERSQAEKPDREDWWSNEKCECRNE
jgi:hypothetical protein